MIFVTVKFKTKNNSLKSHSFPLHSQISYFRTTRFSETLPAVFQQLVHSVCVAQVFDGWVMKGQRFPSLQDHPLPLHQRYVDYCNSDELSRRTGVRSSQNVFMLSFHIRHAGDGFTITARQHLNPFRESPTRDPPPALGSSRCTWSLF